MSPSRSRAAAALLAVAVVAVSGAAAHATQPVVPFPVVERFLTVRDREVRTTLLSNGVAVVSVRRGGEPVLLRQRTLDADQFAGFLAAIQRDAAEIAASDERPTATGSGGRGEVNVPVAPGGPLRFAYSSMSIYDLATTRLLGVIDDIEQLILFEGPGTAALAAWRPAVGDVVRLRRGGLAEVVEVRDDGTLILEHQSTYINELVPPGLLESIVLEVVESP